VDGSQMCAVPTSRCLCPAFYPIPLTMLELVGTGELTEEEDGHKIWFKARYGWLILCNSIIIQ
jgi:hypothetical protein